jgi:hypothetical protein
MNNQQQIKKIRHGIYNVNGITGQTVNIKGAGTIKLGPGDIIKDNLLNKFDIIKNIHGEINKCNIVDTYLMSNKKLPVLYISVVYEKPLVRDVLFTIFLYFTITDDIKKEDELINTNINGNFSVEMIMNKTNIVLDSEISNSGYVSDENVINDIKKMIFSAETTPIIQNLINIKDEERRQRILKMRPGNIICEPPKISYKFDDLL